MVLTRRRERDKVCLSRRGADRQRLEGPIRSPHPLVSYGSILHILPSAEKMPFQHHSETGAGQIPGAAQEQGDIKQCCGECEWEYTVWVIWIRGKEKWSTLPGRFLDKSVSDDLLWVHSGKVWQHSPNQYKLYILESWQQEQPCSVCSNQGSWLLGPSSFQCGRSDGGLWSAGCGTSSPLTAPNCMVTLWAHMLHPDCT